jgi:competence protein ComFC
MRQMLSYFNMRAIKKKADTFRQKSRELVESIVNIIYPNLCCTCKAQLSEGERLLCKKCSEEIKIIPTPHCIKCGRHLPVKGICGECRSGRHLLESVYCACIFDGVMKECIHNFKYKNRLTLMQIFKDIVFEFAIDNPFMENVDIVVPVPLHPARLRQRAYNQSVIIASEIAHTFSLPLEDRILKKIKNTRPQSALDKNKRQQNIKGSFALKKPSFVKGKRILLVDDVFTTGATANECASVLLKAGAKSVSCFTLARGL